MLSKRIYSVFIVLILILVQSFIGDVVGSFSGLYVDNGIGQTVMQENIPRAHTQEMKHEILALLGLPNRPLNTNTTTDKSSLRRSVPKLLLNIYEQLNAQDYEMVNEGSHRSRRSINDDINFNQISVDANAKIIEESDSIMTFLSNKISSPMTKLDNGIALSFDLSEGTQSNSVLLFSELHIFKRKLATKEKSSELFILTVRAVTTVDGIRALREITSINTTDNFQGWIHVNVTNLLVDWIDDVQNNHTLYITVKRADDHFESTVQNTNRLLNVWDDAHQPFVMGYFKNHHQIVRAYLLPRDQPNKRRTKRNTHESRSTNPLVDFNQNGQHSDIVHSCQRYTLYISFKDLDWKDWIIAPEGYGAFYCSGDCGFPMTTHTNPTNHAIIQTLAHLMRPTRVPKPCCAPTKLSAISVLYMVNDKSANLRKYRNMVAKSCGCQ